METKCTVVNGFRLCAFGQSRRLVPKQLLSDKDFRAWVLQRTGMQGSRLNLKQQLSEKLFQLSVLVRQCRER